MPGSFLSLTCLPNGFDPRTGRPQLSISLLPTIDGALRDSVAFKNWPTNLAAIRKAIDSSHVNFQTAASIVACPIRLSPESADASQDAKSMQMWAALFDYQLDNKASLTNRPKTAANYRTMWTLSHDAATMRYTHLQHRRDRMAAEITAQMTGDRSRLEKANVQQQSIDLYLNPSAKPLSPDDGRLPFATLLQARQDALQFCTNIAQGIWPTGSGAPASQSFARLGLKRFQHAMNLLEHQEERLMDIGIYAVFLSCASSLTRHSDPGDLQVSKDASTAFQLVADYATGTNLPQTIDKTALDQAIRYAEFLLYSRRSRVLMKGKHVKAMDAAPPAQPDFHQTIDLLRRFPAMLRPLGLIFDVTLDIAKLEPAANGTYQISIASDISMPGISGNPTCFWTTADLVQPANVGSGIFRASNVPTGTGTAAPQGNNFTIDRYLNLAAVGDANDLSANAKVYSFVSEDFENETHKRVQSAKAHSQAQQYASSANQPQSQGGSGLDPLPSTRTGGLTLLHTQRLERIDRGAQRVANSDLGSLKMPFFADDLILGYRFDVRLSNIRGKPGDWYALGSRRSTYEFVDAKLKKIGLVWEPSGIFELGADEGFVSAATTITKPDPNDGETQLQAHQALFTWSGPGIGYTPPSGHTEAINDDGITYPVRDDSIVLRMQPNHFADGHLLQLRFRYSYDMRCRIVDIAGNSAPPKDSPADRSIQDAIVLSTVMQRHEPLRSPQVLLTDKLDRIEKPGAQSDRMVVRTKGDRTTRALVPPREGLRFAFMHGVVKDSSTKGAFSNIELNNDGSFPSVDDNPSSVEGRDAIFRYTGEDSDPDAPFFPDPLATQLRIKLGDCSVPMGVTLDNLIEAIKETFSFYPTGANWPFCSPCRIRLIGGPEGSQLTAKAQNVLLDDDGPDTLLVAGLVITLPPGSVVSLKISSAGVDVTASGKTAAGIAMKTALALQTGPQNFLALQGGVLPVPYRSQMAVSKPSSSDVPALVTRIRATAISLPQPLADVPVMTLQEQGYALLSGHYACSTPPHTVTLVHAVEKPLRNAQPNGANFEFTREPGQTAAKLVSGLPGDAEIWKSAAKITCHATWNDRIDDPGKAKQTEVKASEQVFEISAVDWLKKIDVFHHLRDTRAHDITYRLSATTAFRDYFPENAPAENFIRDSKALKTINVASSVRPPAPVISYCVPSFAWREDDNPACRGWVRQRAPAIRCYVERPFLLSGDKEMLAVTLLREGQADEPKKPEAKYISRIGQDPLWHTDPSQSLPNALAASAFSAGEIVHNLQLMEMQKDNLVDIVAFPTHYAADRKLWYCDIPFNLTGQYTPFVRLAVVRYQPQALKPETDSVEARISPVVSADFCQVAPNRYASLVRNGRDITLTVSGDAYAKRAGGTLDDPSLGGTKDARPVRVPFDNTFTVELQHRWHKLPLDFDPGWRPTGFQVPPPKRECEGGTVTWTFQFKLPHSPEWFKYRMLLEESETLYADSPEARSHNTQDWSIDLLQNHSVVAVQRMTYLDFFEI